MDPTCSPRSRHKKFNMPRIRFVEESLLGHFHDPVEDTHLAAVILTNAKSGFELGLEVVLDLLRELVKRGVDTQAGEIVAMNDAGQLELFEVGTARRGFPRVNPMEMIASP